MKNLVFLFAMLCVGNATKAQSTSFNITNNSGIPACTDVYVVLYAYDITNCTLVGQSVPILAPLGTTTSLTYSPDFTNSSFWVSGLDPVNPGCGCNWEFTQAYVYADPVCKGSPAGSSSCTNGAWDGVFVEDHALISCGSYPPTDCFQVSGPGGSCPCSSMDQLNIAMPNINNLDIMP